jgi:hypothetical protein
LVQAAAQAPFWQLSVQHCAPVSHAEPTAPHGVEQMLSVQAPLQHSPASEQPEPFSTQGVAHSPLLQKPLQQLASFEQPAPLPLQAGAHSPMLSPWPTWAGNAAVLTVMVWTLPGFPGGMWQMVVEPFGAADTAALRATISATEFAVRYAALAAARVCVTPYVMVFPPFRPRLDGKGASF